MHCISIAAIFLGYFFMFKNDSRIVLVIIRRILFRSWNTLLLPKQHTWFTFPYACCAWPFPFYFHSIVVAYFICEVKNRDVVSTTFLVKAIDIYWSGLNDNPNWLSYDLFTCYTYRYQTNVHNTISIIHCTITSVSQHLNCAYIVASEVTKCCFVNASIP